MVDYKLYTFPNCDKCTAVKQYLKDRKIKFTETNIGLGEGKKEFSGLYPQIREQLKRDSEHGNSLILPILIRTNGSGIEIIVQGIEGAKELFENHENSRFP